MDLLNSLTENGAAGLIIGSMVMSVIVFMMTRMINESKKDRLIKVLRSKERVAAEHMASVIKAAESKAKKNSDRNKKYAFNIVNYWGIKRDLRSAGLPEIPVLVPVAAAVLAALVARLVINVPILPFMVQFWMVLGPCYIFIRYSILSFLDGKRRVKLVVQLVSFIEAVQRSVSVGASPDEAVSEAIQYVDNPLQAYLLQIKELIKLGYDFIDAINLAAEQIDLPEFDIFAASLAAQAKTGGSIGAVLKEVVEIARSRLELRKKVETMTAEGRFNAMLLGSLPIGLGMYLRAAQPEYFHQLWLHPSLGVTIYLGTIFMAVFGAVFAVSLAKMKI